VFDAVARDVILGGLEGFNGTIFAYGQTGSGKTFTITGGPERYIDRGIIPRAISLIYSEQLARPTHRYTVMPLIKPSTCAAYSTIAQLLSVLLLPPLVAHAGVYDVATKVGPS
jgi:Kinesin motor domain